VTPSPPADLLAAAREAHANAYAPYSGFRVGAALRADDGSVVAGGNVENASFGLSRCAEQSAVQALVTRGRRHFREMVVFAEADPPASPCGACRQILHEFAPDATIFLVNGSGACEAFTVANLLPRGFGLKPGGGGA